MRSGIALGTNQGDRLRNLQAAFATLRSLHSDTSPFLVSRVYETDPVDCEPGTQAFWNAAVEMDFDGLPSTLLDRLQAIEAGMGRPSKRPRNAPRPIDLDILHCGNLVLNNREIIIPHPRLHLRRFVLAPLADISPDLVLPGRTETIAELLAVLDDPAEVRPVNIDLTTL